MIVQAMYEKKLPRVRLEDGTLGIPADALDSFQVPTLDEPEGVAHRLGHGELALRGQLGDRVHGLLLTSGER